MWRSFPERRRRKENIKALSPAAKTGWTQMKSSSRPQDVFQRQEEAVKKEYIKQPVLESRFCLNVQTHHLAHAAHRLPTWQQRRTSCHQSASAGLWCRSDRIRSDSAFERRLGDTFETHSAPRNSTIVANLFTLCVQKDTVAKV